MAGRAGAGTTRHTWLPFLHRACACTRAVGLRPQTPLLHLIAFRRPAAGGRRLVRAYAIRPDGGEGFALRIQILCVPVPKVHLACPRDMGRGCGAGNNVVRCLRECETSHTREGICHIARLRDAVGGYVMPWAVTYRVRDIAGRCVHVMP